MFSDYELGTYVQHKVHNAKHYDRRRGFYDPVQAVDKQWILHQMKTQFNRCGYCLDKMTSGESPSSKTDLTVERLDNSKAHNKDNCILSCMKCNTWRSDNCSSEEWEVMDELGMLHQLGMELKPKEEK